MSGAHSEITPAMQAVVSGAKQLNKLKRFLTTLLQFSSDISPDISECVKMLVLKLINSAIAVEDFHSRLQEITNFPLRPFVIPFLKVNLPLLQNELLYFDQHPDLMFQQNNSFNNNASHKSDLKKKITTTDETSLSFGQARKHSQPNGQTSNPLAHLMLMNPQAQQYFADMFPYGKDTADIHSHQHSGQFGDI